MRLLHAFIISAMLATTPTAFAADNSDDDDDVLELSVDENLATPSVPSNAKAYIRASIDQLRRHMVKDGFTVSTTRDGEVLQVVIPCSTLFAPCATELKPSANDVLRNFGIVVREPAKYKLIVAVNADDTGDEMYADSITAARANAIDDYLWQLAGQRDTNVVPYGLGKDEPLEPNTTRHGRAANRRVDFFIVPDRGLLEMAGVKRK